MTSNSIENEQSMIQFGVNWSATLQSGDLVFLNGDLGAGKTTLVKGVLLGLGYTGAVTSPTYTLVESYLVNKIQIFHFDLYRIQSARELETIGIRDMLSEDSICLMEWAEKGNSVLPRPNYQIDISYNGSGRLVEIRQNE